MASKNLRLTALARNEELTTVLNQLRDDDDITVEDFNMFNDLMVDWREKAREEAIKDVAPK